MSHEAIEQLIERWLNEPKFRKAIRNDPEKAVRQTGIQLSEEEWLALRRLDWSLSDEDLKTRIAKAA